MSKNVNFEVESDEIEGLTVDKKTLNILSVSKNHW
jgi:hypothetical protein